MGLIGSIVGALLDLASDPTRDAAAGEEASGWERYQEGRKAREEISAELQTLKNTLAWYVSNTDRIEADRNRIIKERDEAQRLLAEARGMLKRVIIAGEKWKDIAQRMRSDRNQMIDREKKVIEERDLAVAKYDLYRAEMRKASAALLETFTAVAQERNDATAAVEVLTAFVLEVIDPSPPKIKRGCAHFCERCAEDRVPCTGGLNELKCANCSVVLA